MKSLKNFKAIFIGAVLAVAVLFLGGTYFKYYNLGVTMERSVKTVSDNNKVVLNTYTTKVQEVAQVPTMYKQDLKDIIKSTFEGRYGQDGSQAVFQMIKEQNINPDPTMYRQIQQVMESGRNDFKTSQQQLVDVTQNYKASLDYAWSGFWLNLAGYPKINLDDYKILVTDEVDAKFKSGKDEVIQLNK